MARKRMVTRTVKITKGVAGMVNLATRELEEKEFLVNGKYKDENSLIDAVQSAFPGNKVSYIVSSENKDLYVGITEAEFLAHPNLKVLKKPTKSEEATVEEVEETTEE